MPPCSPMMVVLRLPETNWRGLTCSGCVTNEVEKKLDSLIDAAQVRLVISLEKLEYISSSGLRVSLAALKKVKKQQGDIKLACLKPYIKEVFDIAGFTELFNMSDTEEAAVNSFKEA